MTFAIDIHKEVEVNGIIYGIIYLDFPKFSYEKRIYQIVKDDNSMHELGLSFSKGLDYYTQDIPDDLKNIKQQIKKYSRCNRTEKKEIEMLFNNFEENQVIKKMVNDSNYDMEQKIIVRLYEEVKGLIW